MEKYAVDADTATNTSTSTHYTMALTATLEFKIYFHKICLLMTAQIFAQKILVTTRTNAKFRIYWLWQEKYNKAKSQADGKTLSARCNWQFCEHNRNGQLGVLRPKFPERK